MKEQVPNERVQPKMSPRLHHYTVSIVTRILNLKNRKRTCSRNVQDGTTDVGFNLK